MKCCIIDRRGRVAYEAPTLRDAVNMAVRQGWLTEPHYWEAGEPYWRGRPPSMPSGHMIVDQGRAGK